MTKKTKIILTTIVAVIVAVVIVAMIVFVPRRGTRNDEVWDPESIWSPEGIACVEKTAGEDMKILAITDIQLWSSISDNREAWASVDEIVARERPGLILLPGDIVSGIDTDILVKDVVKHMDSYGVPWAPVNGNHEAEGNADLDWQAEQYMKSEYCLMSKGPRNLYGVGNYFFLITEDKKPIYSFGMLDHGRYYDYGKDEKYSNRPVCEIYMSYEQINWYEWNLKGIEREFGKVPNIAVKHFAPPEMKRAIEKYGKKGSDGRIYVERGPQNENGGYGVGKGQGSCAYLPSVAPINTGFVDMLARNGVTTHILVGHDHENSAWITDDNGITYMYGLKTGPSPKYWNEAIEYGCTVFTLSTDEYGAHMTARNIVTSDGKYAK